MNTIKFANVKTEQIRRLMEDVSIGEVAVSTKAMEQIEDILNLKDMDVDELRATRNTIVKEFSIHMEKAEENNDIEAMRDFMKKCSGITAVIDSNIWKCGGEV